MKKIMEKMKFEQVMIFSIMAILTVALFNFSSDKEILNLILGALIGAFTSHTTLKRDTD